MDMITLDFKTLALLVAIMGSTLTVGGHEILPSGGHVAARWRPTVLPSGGQQNCPR